jgi:ADP-ribose pyrophosphatase
MSDSPPRHRKAPPIQPHPGLVVEQDEVVWAERFALQRVRFRYTRFDGALSAPLTWELWRRGQGVLVLPYDPRSDRVALIEQFRLPALAAGLDPVMVECPAGLLETGEDPEVSARRELAEETGLVAGRMALIGQHMLMQGGCDDLIHFWCAEVDLGGAGGTHGLVTEGEETRVMVLPAADAFARVATNAIRNAPAALALLWLQVNHGKLMRDWNPA